MITYRCPRCRRKAFEAAAPVSVEIAMACSRCREVVRPVAEAPPLTVRAYQCSRCRREQSCTDPANDRSYCIICGTPTLVIVAEATTESAQSAEPGHAWSSP